MNKKISIIIIVILCIFSIVVYLLFRNNEEEDNSNNINNEEEVIYDYLIIDNTSMWSYQEESNTWDKTNYSSIDNSYLNVYINNNYIGYYKLVYGNVWNIFDSSDNYISYDGTLIASTLDLDVIDYTLSTIDSNDLTTIRSIINYNVLEQNLSISEKVVVDLDSNGILDNIVNVSNLDNTDSVYFNLLYITLNGEVIVLVNNIIDESNLYIEPIYNIKAIFNYDNSYDNIIMQRGYFSNVGETENLMFSYNDGDYLLVIED